MNELEIFKNEEFGQVRTLVDKDGAILFCASDVAQALGYAKPRNAINAHCKGALKRGSLTNGGVQELTFIPEPDVYRLIMKSKLPSAERFEKWVFEEVLPTIRKHGGYVTWDKLQDIMTNPHSLAEFLRQMLLVTEENVRLKKVLDELEPKGDYFDSLVDNNLLVNFRTAAKEIGIKPMRFTQFLLDKKYVFRDTKQTIHPMQPYVHCGFFEIKEFCRNGHCGTQTLITPKGRQHFLEVLTQCDII